MRKVLVEYVPGLAGGLVGGIVGYFLFDWFLRYGFFAPVLPGALCGLACGLVSRTDSLIRGILCSIEALVIGIWADFKLMIPPFDTDGSFQDFVTKVPQLPPPTLLMLGVGVLLGFWWGKECTIKGRRLRKEPPTD